MSKLFIEGALMSKSRNIALMLNLSLVTIIPQSCSTPEVNGNEHGF